MTTNEVKKIIEELATENNFGEGAEPGYYVTENHAIGVNEEENTLEIFFYPHGNERNLASVAIDKINGMWWDCEAMTETAKRETPMVGIETGIGEFDYFLD